MALQKDKDTKSRVSFRERLSLFFRKTDIRLLIVVPPLISLVLLASSGYIFEKFNNTNKIPDSFLAPVGAIAAFISGFSGLIQIIRQEAPGILGVPVRGFWPVFTGVIWLIFCWVSCVILVYLAFAG